MFILLIANVVILPIAISFLYEDMTHTGLLVFNLISDTMFLFNIIISFRTGIYTQNLDLALKTYFEFELLFEVF